MDGLNILTDPIFSDRASPISWFGPKRVSDLPVDLDSLPPIDVVIISHDHYDHLDAPTIDRLGDRPHYLVPLGFKEWLADRGIIRKVTELDWWEGVEIRGVRFVATPSQHWCARSHIDRNERL